MNGFLQNRLFVTRKYGGKIDSKGINIGLEVALGDFRLLNGSIGRLVAVIVSHLLRVTVCVPYAHFVVRQIHVGNTRVSSAVQE